MGVLWTGVQTCAFRIWDKAAGFDVYWTHGKVDDAVRVAIARLARAEPGDVALIGNASDGIAKVASGFDWRAGDNVVAPELDYASRRFALASLKKLGVELRLVQARGDRQSVVSGQSVSVSVDLGGRRILKKKKTYSIRLDK